METEASVRLRFLAALGQAAACLQLVMWGVGRKEQWRVEKLALIRYDDAGRELPCRFRGGNDRLTYILGRGPSAGRIARSNLITRFSKL
jgi:hypothetical protein